MSHTNAHVPDVFVKWRDEERISALEAEVALWRRRAEHLAGEMANIPRALREYGQWYITDTDGEITHVILDPRHHPKEAEE